MVSLGHTWCLYHFTGLLEEGRYIVVRSLLACRIEFDILKCVHTLCSEKWLEEWQSVGLGCFKMPPEFDVTIYGAYEKAKRNMISSSMGWVALMCGGIVWWLAQGLVKVKHVTKGLNFTQCTSFGMLKDRELVANRLPQANEDIICGVYHIQTGISFISSSAIQGYLRETRHQDFVVAKNKHMVQ